MPELPELEVAKKTLAPCVEGKTIDNALVGREQAIRTPLRDGPAFAAGVDGRRVMKIERRGKALVFLLDRDRAVVFHYKLGAVAVCRPKSVDETKGVAWNFTDGSALEFTDFQLSEFHLVPAGQLDTISVLKEGANPIDRSFTLERMRDILPGGKQLKAALMDQNRIGGIGNHYSDEILYNARLNPFRKVSSLSDAEMRQLYDQIKLTLREAISKGGEPAFHDAGGRSGRYQNHVHRRAGQPCDCDGGKVEMVRKGRATFYCPSCQK